MPLPGISRTIKDGGLGLADADPSEICIKVGVCTLGTNNVLEFFADPDALKTARGQGPVVDSAIYHLLIAGGVVGVLKVNSSIAGTATAVSVSRGAPGDSTGTMTTSGAPNDAYDVKVEITKQGTNIAAGTAAFKYSLDGGDNYSDEIALPTGGTYLLGDTNVTLTFVNGGGGTSFKVGDVHSFTCTAPGYSSTDLNAALDALRTTYAETEFGFVHIVGQAASSAGAATIATAADVKMTAEQNVHRYTFALVEWPDESDATIQASVAAFTSARIVPIAGFCELLANNKLLKRSAGTVVAARLSQQRISRDLGRTKPDTEGGPIQGVTKIYRDEGTTPGLDDYGFTTLRTYAGQRGFYITHGRMRVAAGSDFKFTQYRRVMDRACAITHSTLFPHLNDDEFITKADGTLDELDARNLESELNSALRNGLVSERHVSDAYCVVNRQENMAQTLKLKVKTRIRPKGYAKFIEEEIGFENVSLRPQ